LISRKTTTNYLTLNPNWYGSPLIAISPDGDRIVTASDSAIDLRKPADGSLIASLDGLSEDEWIYRMAFSPDGKYLAVSGDKGPRLYHLDSSQPEKMPIDQSFSPVAFSPDNKILAGFQSNYISFVNITSGQKIGEIQDNGITSLAYSPMGDLLAIGDTTGSVSLWNPHTQKLVRKLSVPGTWGMPSMLSYIVLGIWILVAFKLWSKRNVKIDRAPE
jgi:WD40 repeat protein